MRQACYDVGGGDDGGGSGGVSCQDCGNQAKKDCQHIRCRTCCRSRGLPCQTHVKSTWTPAAKRHERHQHLSLISHHHNSGNQSDGAGPDQNPKRPRQDRQLQYHIGAGGSNAVLPTPHLYNSSSGFHFPALMSSPAVFQCIRVNGADGTNEQLAYQTAVNVGGHVFNGILYDHGPDPGLYNNHVSAAAIHHDVNPISLGTTAADSTIYPDDVAIVDPSPMYPTPLSAFMASTQFFPPPRS